MAHRVQLYRDAKPTVAGPGLDGMVAEAQTLSARPIRPHTCVWKKAQYRGGTGARGIVKKCRVCDTTILVFVPVGRLDK